MAASAALPIEALDQVTAIAHGAAREATRNPAKFVALGHEALTDVAATAVEAAGFDPCDEDVWETTCLAVDHVIEMADPDSELNSGKGSRPPEPAVAAQRHVRVHAPRVRRVARRRGAGRPRARALARASSRSGDSGDSDDPEPARRGVRVGDTSRSFRASLHPSVAARFDAILPDLGLWERVRRAADAHVAEWTAA